MPFDSSLTFYPEVITDELKKEGWKEILFNRWAAEVEYTLAVSR